LREGSPVLVCLWTLKAGTGCSVTAALVALQRSSAGSGVAVSEGGADGVTLIDADGDLAAVLGIAEPMGAGMADWLRAGDDAPSGALAAAAAPVTAGLRLVGPGEGTLPPVEPTDRQLAALAETDGLVVVDAGCVLRDDRLAAFGRRVAATATRSILVTRPCYLALRRIGDAPIVPSGVILLAESGRSLGRRDVEAAVGAPVVASLAVDASIARAVDAGLLAARVPRGAARSLSAVA